MNWRDVLSPRLLTHLLLLRPILKLFFGLNVRGRGHLRGLDRFVLISNHNSHLDVLLLFAVLPVGKIRRTRAVAARDYFSRSRALFGAVDFLFRPVWVDRDRRGGGTVARLQEVLDDGGSLVLFPEGTRGRPGELQPFRSGLGRIALANPSVPVVPVWLEGPERALPRAARFPVPLWNHATVLPPRRYGGGGDIGAALHRTLWETGERARRARPGRPSARRSPVTVGVLGIDGSGKSTLSRRLARALSAESRSCAIGDSLELWERREARAVPSLAAEKLRRWLGARAKDADSLGRYKIPKLAEILLRDLLLGDVGRWCRPEWIVLDGMPALNLCAWSVLYHRKRLSPVACLKILSVLTRQAPTLPKGDPVFTEYPDLEGLRRLHLDRLHLPDVAVLLDVPPEICVERIESRGEARQVHETREKLGRLRDAYRLVCSVLERDFGVPVLVLSGDPDPERIARAAERFIANTRRDAA